MKRFAYPICLFVAMFGLLASRAIAQEADRDQTIDMSVGTQTQDLQLEVFLNDEPLNLIAAFSQDQGGRLRITADELAQIGVANANGASVVALDDIVGLSYRVNHAEQSVYIELGFAQRAVHSIDARATPYGQKPDMPVSSSALGLVTNYILYASAGDGESDDFGFDQFSGLFDTRLVSSFGKLDNGYLVRVSERGEFDDPLRLNTTWTYADEQRLMSYRAGDVISGGLSWTRPTWLGGIQIQRNFSLRPDLVTLPLPSLGGSAAVPSSVELFVDNALRYSANVPTGPFVIENAPLVTGSGNARMVVRDALGRETVVESPFFVSSEMIAVGMLDFSLEAGFARRYYGQQSFDYDERPAAMATARYGLSNRLTLEGHLEGMEGLINGGFGAVTTLGRWGTASASAAASSDDGNTGYQFGAGLTLELWGAWIHAGTRRSFEHYQDVAGVVAEAESPLGLDLPFTRSSAPPRAVDQVSLGVPLRFDRSTLNFSYAHVETVENEKYSILSAAYSRQMFRSLYLSASAYTNLNDNSYGMQFALSRQFGETYASAGVISEERGTSAYVEASKRPRWETNELGYRVRLREGESTYRGASLFHEASTASVELGVEQYESDRQVYAEAQGSVALAGGGVYFARKVDDAAFAVVDVGTSGVLVKHDNRAAGRTGRNGKLLVSGLRPYEANRLSIDPDTLPIDVTIDATSLDTVPSQGGIASVNFGARSGEGSGAVTLLMGDGSFAELGREATLNGGEERFMVGYNGQVFLTGLQTSNKLVLGLDNGETCIATFNHSSSASPLTGLGDVICR